MLICALNRCRQGAKHEKQRERRREREKGGEQRVHRVNIFFLEGLRDSVIAFIAGA